nr:MAG TPA: YvrJ protein family protein [Caudoviricetes sp.]
MQWEQIVALIGQIGFPIVCCVMMWKQMLTQQEQHKSEMDELKDALNNNTKAIELLTERFNTTQTKTTKTRKKDEQTEV